MIPEEIFESLGWKPADPKGDRWGRSVYVNPARPAHSLRVVLLTSGEINATYELTEGLALWSADGLEAIQARLEKPPLGGASDSDDTGRETTD